MVNQTNTNVARSQNTSNEKKENAFPGYSSGLHSSRKSQSKENPLNDDLIMSLSEAYENKRARQVTEWERRQNVHLSV